MADPIQSVAVLGAGSAGLLAALALKQFLPHLKVTVLSSESLPPIGVGESTTPELYKFLHEELELDQGAFLRAVRPTWKLGVKLNWGPERAPEYFYPFDVPFSSRRAGLAKKDGYYQFADGAVCSPFTELMRQGRSPLVLEPSEVDVERGFAYHIENRSFIQFLTRVAEERGVELRQFHFAEAARGENGFIQSLLASDGQSVEAELYVDASGFAARLIRGVYQRPFESYATSLFCDRAIVGSRQRSEPTLPYTSADMMQHGWCWRVELPDRINRGYVFSSRYCDAAQARAELAAFDPNLEIADRVLDFSPGRVDRCFFANVAAVGNASGFVEPLEATGLHLVISTIRQILAALVEADCRWVPELTQAANSVMRETWNDVAAFLALHFKLNQRGRTEFWKDCREKTELRDASAALQLFDAAGPTSAITTQLSRYSIFGLDGYASVLLGSGAPSAYRFSMAAPDERIWAAHKQALGAWAKRRCPMDRALRSLKLQSAEATSNFIH